MNDHVIALEFDPIGLDAEALRIARRPPGGNIELVVVPGTDDDGALIIRTGFADGIADPHALDLAVDQWGALMSAFTGNRIVISGRIAYQQNSSSTDLELPHLAGLKFSLSAECFAFHVFLDQSLQVS
jgi:hypothetical protein